MPAVCSGNFPSFLLWGSTFSQLRPGPLQFPLRWIEKRGQQCMEEAPQVVPGRRLIELCILASTLHLTHRQELQRAPHPPPGDFDTCLSSTCLHAIIKPSCKAISEILRIKQAMAE